MYGTQISTFLIFSNLHHVPFIRASKSGSLGNLSGVAVHQPFKNML